MKIIEFVETNNIIYPHDDPLYFSEKLKTNYYNYYYSYGLHFKPKNIFEIGVRNGYTAYYLLLGSNAQKFRGIDLETYVIGSNDFAIKLIKKVCENSIITYGNSHDLTSLDEKYDLIHIDGDHSYQGKIQDLELSLNNISDNGVIVVDDYNDNVGKEVKNAVDYFVESTGIHMKVYNTYTGHALLSKVEIK